jgi:hypothetical protein
LHFAERDKCKLFLLKLSLAGNMEKPLSPSMGPNGVNVARDPGTQKKKVIDSNGGRSPTGQGPYTETIDLRFDA